MAIEVIHDYPLEKLTPTSNNPRTIKKGDFERLKKSITDFGEMLDVREIVVDENDRILGGHQRVRALLATKKKTATIKRISGWTEEQKREFIIRDNIQNGEWDMDILANEWDDLPLDDWGIEIDAKDDEQSVIEDEVPEISDEDIVSRQGEIYALGEHRLMCGNSCNIDDVQRLMDGKEADLWLTDPPYNVDYQGGTKDKLKILNDKMGDSAFSEFLTDAYTAASVTMKSGAAFYIWHSGTEGYNFHIAARNVGWTVRECLIWNKNSLVLGRQDYQWKHEHCLYGWKDGSHVWYGDRKQTTVIDFDRPKKSEDHPTMKPVGLFAYQIKNSTKSGDIVLDSFAGSGTTMAACEQLGRRAYIMELDPKYCDVIRKRYCKLKNGNIEGWEKETPSI